jgi:hypothetical protein
MTSFGSREARGRPRAWLILATLAATTHAGNARTMAVAAPFIRQAGNIPKGQTSVSPLAGVGFDNFVELGVAVSFLIVPHGFVPPINNSVHGEAVAFFDVAGRDPTGFVGGRMRWDFHLHPKWSAFGAPGFGVRFGDDDRHTGAELTGVVGGFFHIDDAISLRAETDVVHVFDHAGLRGGVTFRF